VYREEGSAPPMFDKDDPIVADTAASAGGTGDGTYTTLSNYVIHAPAGSEGNANTHSLKDRTYQREAGQWHQAEHPTGICSWLFCPMSTSRDPSLLDRKFTRRGEVVRGAENGEMKLFHPPPRPPSPPLSPEDSDSKGLSSPDALAAARPTLLSHRHRLCLCACHLLLSAWFAPYLAISSGKVTPRGSLCTHPRPYKSLAVLKPNRTICKHTDANCSSFHLRVFLGLSNPLG
jgi:hypothetical protein